MLIAALLAASAPVQPGSADDAVSRLMRQTHWGETSGELLRQFPDNARHLPRPLDFGDSYADVVLEGQTLGGVPVIVFFQLDKQSGGLKRIQLERPRHGVNPPAFRAIAGALHCVFGRPDEICAIPVRPSGGYQAAAEERWVRGSDTISAIYRDTTLEAFEGCLYGVTSGHCGLTGQILVRVSPANGRAAADPCSFAIARRPPAE